MEFEVGQWVKFKSEKEYLDRRDGSAIDFRTYVNKDSVFQITASSHDFVTAKTKDGYEFGCRIGRLVPIIHILSESEEL